MLMLISFYPIEGRDSIICLLKMETNKFQQIATSVTAEFAHLSCERTNIVGSHVLSLLKGFK